MKFNPYKHHRRSIRLRGYDYSQPGWYFITICTQDHLMFFGDVVDGKMILNTAGRVVEQEWLRTGIIRKNVELDYYVVMPNHIHGIIAITELPDVVGAHCNVPLRNVPNQLEKFGHSTKNSIPTIIKLFKSTTTKQINYIHKTPGSRFWQRNYYACPDEYWGTYYSR